MYTRIRAVVRASPQIHMYIYIYIYSQRSQVIKKKNICIPVYEQWYAQAHSFTCIYMYFFYHLAALQAALRRPATSV
jgi:hypothetical protein